MLIVITIIGFVKQRDPVRVEIREPHGPVKSQRDPFGEPFTAHNSGDVDLTDLEAGCLLNRVEIPNMYDIGPLSLPPIKLADLPAGQQATVTCAFNSQIKLSPEQIVTEAYILVWIRGRTPGRSTYTAQQSFELWKAADAMYYWLPQAQQRWKNPF